MVDVLTTHRSRVLMFENIKNLRAHDIFQLVIGKCAGRGEPENIFQPQVGKWYAVIKQGCDGAHNTVLSAIQTINPSTNIFQKAFGKCIPAQYKRMLIPKEVLQRTFEEYLALPQNIEEEK